MSKRAKKKAASIGVMSPSNERWEEFCERLSGAEGCDFRKEEQGNLKFKCGNDFSAAGPILKDMGADVKASLSYFEGHGGYCDCEILFNVRS